MKVTRENLKYVENNQSLLESLLIDLEELNQLLEDKDESYRKLYIDYQDYHNEYSPVAGLN